MMKMKRQITKLSALFTSAVMCIINVPVVAESLVVYTNGIKTDAGYTEFEQPGIIDSADLAQLGYTDIQAYEIDSAGELAWFIQHFYIGDLVTQNVSLAGDIDMSILQNYSWTPIGYYNETSLTGQSYDGVFDGNGYSISNIYMNQKTGNDLISSISAEQNVILGGESLSYVTQDAIAGVFGYIGTRGMVTELELENISITGTAKSAIFSGRNDGTINGCIIKSSQLSSYTSASAVTEFSAENQGEIHSSYANVNIVNMLEENQETPILLDYMPGYVAGVSGSNVTAIYTVKKEAETDILNVYEAPEGVKAYETSQFADGAAAWGMNENLTAALFGQQIDVDAEPEFLSDEYLYQVYRVTLDYASEEAEDTFIYTNSAVPDTVFSMGIQWQQKNDDESLIDVAAPMTIEKDVTLVEKIEEPTTPEPTTPEPTTPVPTTPEPTTAEPTTPVPTTPEPTTPEPTTTQRQKVDPVYIAPIGLEGYVGKPLSDIGLPSDAVGLFVWETNPATLLPAGTETANALVSYVPVDTETYNTIYSIIVTIKINKFDPTPLTQCADSFTIDEGMTLGQLPLPEGWSWLDPTITPENGAYTVVYTPQDTLTYNTLQKLVRITVEPTQPADVTAPQISGIEEGKTYCGAVVVKATDENTFTVKVNDNLVTLDNGSFTLEPAEGKLIVEAEDEAGNISTINVWVNNGHTFVEGTCTFCGDDDPNYNPGPVENRNIPDVSISSETSTQINDNDWSSVEEITLTAPEGYNVVENLMARSRRESVLTIYLQPGENDITYYIVSKDNKQVSEPRTRKLHLDKVAPQVNGLEEGKTYCGSVQFTVVESNLDRTTSQFAPTVTETSSMSFTANAAEGQQTLILRDKAGNETVVHYTVNSGHSFENGVCTVCTAPDPNYKAPAVQSTTLPDAIVTTPDAGTNWYRHIDITLTAPTGYYISKSSDENNFGEAAILNIELQAGENTIEYYLLSHDKSVISVKKTLTLYFDNTAPVITGIQDAGTYCAAQSVTISDDNLEEITVNGVPVSLTSAGTLTIAPASGVQTIKAVDKAGNEAVITITVNNGHIYSSGICTLCGQDDPGYTVNVDAAFLPEGLGGNGWYRQNAILEAPEGFYIAFTNVKAEFGTNTRIVFEEEGNYTVEYYLMNISSSAISQAKRIELKLDKTAPAIGGIENSKTYCLENKVLISVQDTNLYSVKLNNQEIASYNTLNGSKTFNYEITKAGSYILTAADIAGNVSTVSFQVNENHTWNGGVVQEQPSTTKAGISLFTCQICGETMTQEIPMLTTQAPTPEATTASSAAESVSDTLPMPTTQGSQINQVLGIEDASAVIGIILVAMGVLLAAAVTGMIVLARKSRR